MPFFFPASEVPLLWGNRCLLSRGRNGERVPRKWVWMVPHISQSYSDIHMFTSECFLSFAFYHHQDLMALKIPIKSEIEMRGMPHLQNWPSL